MNGFRASVTAWLGSAHNGETPGGAWVMQRVEEEDATGIGNAMWEQGWELGMKHENENGNWECNMGPRMGIGNVTWEGTCKETLNSGNKNIRSPRRCLSNGNVTWEETWEWAWEEDGKVLLDVSNSSGWKMGNTAAHYVTYHPDDEGSLFSGIEEPGKHFEWKKIFA